jgi:hypothetical protein
MDRAIYSSSEAASFEWRRAFIQTYRERGILRLGARIPAESLHPFWQMPTQITIGTI